jgi:hypothetical protein
VLSLLDIERLKAYEREAALARQLAEEVLQTVGRRWRWSAAGRAGCAPLNHAFAGLLGLSTSEAVGRRSTSWCPKSGDGPQLASCSPSARGGAAAAARHPHRRRRRPPRRLSVRRVEAADDYLLLLTSSNEPAPARDSRRACAPASSEPSSSPTAPRGTRRRARRRAVPTRGRRRSGTLGGDAESAEGGEVLGELLLRVPLLAVAAADEDRGRVLQPPLRSSGGTSPASATIASTFCPQRAAVR